MESPTNKKQKRESHPQQPDAIEQQQQQQQQQLFARIGYDITNTPAFPYDTFDFLLGRFERFQTSFITSAVQGKEHFLIWPRIQIPHLLRCVMIHPEGQRVFLETYDESFTKRMARLKIKNITPLMFKDLPTTKPPLKKRVPYVPEEYREFFRSMVRFVVSLHREGLYTQGFCEQNMVMKRNEIHFVDVKCFRAKMGEDPFMHTVNDFKCIYVIIAPMYEGKGPLPPEFQLWLDNLRYCLWTEPDLVEHVATLSHFERLSYVKEVQEKRVEMRPVHYQARLWMNYPGDVWTTRIDQDEGPLKLCFYHDSGAGANANVGPINPVVALPNPQVMPSSYRVGPSSDQLLRFSRNFAAHGRDYRFKVFPSDPITDQILDLELFSFVGHELCRYQTGSSVARHNRHFPGPLLQFSHDRSASRTL